MRLINGDCHDETRYYVYGLFDPAEDYPFYIGKGTGKRKTTHFQPSSKGHNPYKDRKIEKTRREGREPYSRKLYDNLTEDEAYMREWALINVLFPRLTNLLKSYGEGFGSGKENPMYGRERSEEVKEAIAKKLKGKNYGEDIGNSKLTNEEVKEIKWLLDKGAHQKQIADEYDVSKVTIGKISTEEYWTYVQDKKKPAHLDPEKLKTVRCDKIKEEVAKRMKWLAENPRYTLKQIAKLFGRSCITGVRAAIKRVDKTVEPEEKPEDRDKIKRALEIKAAVNHSNKTYKELAEIYDCCKNNIYNIANGRSFGFLPEEPDDDYCETARRRISEAEQSRKQAEKFFEI